MTDHGKCELCGEPMPAGEEMFKFHGYSGPCPKPLMPKPADTVGGQRCKGERHIWSNEATAEGDTCECGAWYRFHDRIESTS